MAQKSMIEDVMEALDDGQIVALPTDTVWGLVVDSTNAKAVESLYQLKRRNHNKPLILFLSDQKEIEKYVADVPEYAKKFMDNFWPGKLTIIFETDRKIYEAQQTNTIGIRVPNLSSLHELLAHYEKPLLSTSANISDESELKSAAEIRAKFGDAVYIADKFLHTNRSEPSTIVRATHPEAWEIIRLGDISKEALWKSLDEDLAKKIRNKKVGMENE